MLNQWNQISSISVVYACYLVLTVLQHIQCLQQVFDEIKEANLKKTAESCGWRPKQASAAALRGGGRGSPDTTHSSDGGSAWRAAMIPLPRCAVWPAALRGGRPRFLAPACSSDGGSVGRAATVPRPRSAVRPAAMRGGRPRFPGPCAQFGRQLCVEGGRGSWPRRVIRPAALRGRRRTATAGRAPDIEGDDGKRTQRDERGRTAGGECKARRAVARAATARGVRGGRFLRSLIRC
jgi:hypothetical protein